MGDKGWIEVHTELQAYLELVLVILWEDICSCKFLISAKETHLQSNTTGNVTGRTGIEVTGSVPIDVLNFFRLLTQLHKLSSQGGSFFNWPLVMSATFQMSFVTRVRGKLWRRRRHHSLGAGRSAAKNSHKWAGSQATLHKMRYMYV